MNDEKKRRLREIIVEFEEDIKDNYWEFLFERSSENAESQDYQR